jgi:hypothetical protein
MNFTNNYEILQNKVIVNAKKNRKHLLVFWLNVYIIMDFTVIIHFTAISIDGTGVTFYWQNTSRSVHSLFPAVAELSEIS